VGAHSVEKKASFLAGIMLFLRQVVGELKKVVTPTRKELVRYTIVVLLFVVVMIVIATVLDLAFGAGAAFVFGGSSGDN
jgi:preprotein translocase subunit SecE